MSEEINGGPGPNALRNAMRIMGGEVRKMQKVARKRHREGLVKGPRSYCSVCGDVFDFAIVNPTEQLTGGICAKCKAILAEGFTACITSDAYAFIKSDYLKANGMRGKIVPVSVEAMEKIKEQQRKNGISDEKSSGET